MKRNPRLVELSVPMNRRDPEEGQPRDSRPQIRRQLERICEQIEVDFEDLVELYVSYSRVTVVYYLRNDDGELYRNELNKLATAQKRVEVDTYTFIGDEGDI